jgi:hypothetical protein
LTSCAPTQGCAGSRYPLLTRKERDNETGPDFFGARGPDLTNPQALNKYQYWVDDNPAATPTGMTPRGDNMKKRELYHLTTESRRNEMWQTFEQSGSLQGLGTYFHAQQDSFSHAGYGPRWGTSITLVLA